MDNVQPDEIRFTDCTEEHRISRRRFRRTLLESEGMELRLHTKEFQSGRITQRWAARSGIVVDVIFLPEADGTVLPMRGSAAIGYRDTSLTVQLNCLFQSEILKLVLRDANGFKLPNSPV